MITINKAQLYTNSVTSVERTNKTVRGKKKIGTDTRCENFATNYITGRLHLFFLRRAENNVLIFLRNFIWNTLRVENL